MEEFITLPEVETLQFSLEPVHNMVHSLLLLNRCEDLSGLNAWVKDTNDSLSPQERRMNELVTIGFHYVIHPWRSWPSFEAYLETLETEDPAAMRERMIAAYIRVGMRKKDGAWEKGSVADDETLETIDQDAIFASAESYLKFLQERFPPEAVDPDLETEAYSYVVDPPRMKKMIVSHVQDMWEKHLKPEWERVIPMLEDSIRAFEQIDFDEMDKFGAVEFVTGQKLEEGYWTKVVEKAEKIIFVPSPHVGPYLGKAHAGETLWILYGARLPEGSQVYAPDLSRAEIVVRLTALADDSRLQILKLVADEGELKSQEVMNRLDLSQSASSRHLKQLSATGFLAERRCNGAKCYELNIERVDNTLHALSNYLMS
jgi:DNA-binding transcriptional ArsR family regulator